MTRTTARKAYAPKRRRKNPKAGLSPADMRDLGSAAAGGVAAGFLTSYLEGNKPPALAAVPTEIVGAALGVAIAMFGKTPVTKNIAAGMISYSAGNLAANWAGMGQTPAVDPSTAGLYSPNVGALHYTSPPPSAINVAGLTFAVSE
tara:strand:- start:337 stop:774 length:438 start_codon:yes stop_codon:yes gene_type:complete